MCAYNVHFKHLPSGASYKQPKQPGFDKVGSPAVSPLPREHSREAAAEPRKRRKSLTWGHGASSRRSRQNELVKSVKCNINDLHQRQQQQHFTATSRVTFYLLLLQVINNILHQQQQHIRLQTYPGATPLETFTPLPNVPPPWRTHVPI